MLLLKVFLQNGKGYHAKRGNLGCCALDLTPLLASCPASLPKPSSDPEQLYPGMALDFESIALSHMGGGGAGYIGHVWLRVSVVPLALLQSGAIGLTAANRALARALEPRKGAKLSLDFDGAADETISLEQAWSIRHTQPAQYKMNWEALQAVARVVSEHPSVTLRVHCRTDAVERAPQRLADYLGFDADREVDRCMEYLAHRRSRACLQALVSFGVPEARVYETHAASTPRGGSGVLTFHLQLEPPPRAAATAGGATPLSAADDLPESGAARMAAQQAQAMASTRDGVGWMAAAAAEASGLGGVGGMLSPYEIGVFVQQLRLSEAMLRDESVQQVWIEMDLLGMVTDRELLITSRAPKRSAMALPFAQRFDVPDRSHGQRQLCHVLEAARRDPSRKADQVTFTLWSRDAKDERPVAQAQCGISLLEVLESNQEPSGWLPLKGRHGPVGSLHASLGIVPALKAATAAMQRAEEGSRVATASSDQTAARTGAPEAVAAPAPSAYVDAEQEVLLGGKPPLRERIALQLIQRFCRRRHIARKQGRLLTRRSLPTGLPPDAARDDEPSAASLLRAAAVAEETRKIEALLRPPSPVRKQLDRHHAAVLCLQRVSRGVAGRRRADKVRAARARGGAPKVTEVVDLTSAGRTTLGGSQVDAWRTWLAEERQKEAAAALMASLSVIFSGVYFLRRAIRLVST